MQNSSSFADLCCPMSFFGVYAGFMGMYVVAMIAMWALIIVGLVLWIVMIIDAVQRKPEEFPNGTENDRMIWLLIVVLTGWIGGIIYYFMVYKKIPRSK
ncbi:PLDc N-terminal domain-containing protein [Candidatus Dojkabacteria bacterium]|nr:PLDc N-terminal domain-containing protein [Candidatus Dojkabacteria bacterium]